MVRRLFLVPIAILVATASVSAQQTTGWQYGGRVSWVNAAAEAELGDTGNELALRSGPGFEFEFLRF